MNVIQDDFLARGNENSGGRSRAVTSIATIIPDNLSDTPDVEAS